MTKYILVRFIAIVSLACGYSVCGQVSLGVGDSVYLVGVQNKRDGISLACATALTNILKELRGLAQQYPPLSNIRSARIVRDGAPDSGNVELDYVKNNHYEPYHYAPGTPAAQMRPVLGKYVVDNGGASLIVAIRNFDEQQGTPPISHGVSGGFYPLMIVQKQTKFALVYNLELNPDDPVLEKRVRNVVEKQVGILTKTFQDIPGNEIGGKIIMADLSQAFSPSLTNILDGLLGMAQTNVFLNDISSATIENKGTNYLYQHLRYWKNAQAETTTNTEHSFNTTPSVGKAGMSLDIYILKSDEPFGFVAGNGYDYTFVSADGKEKISLIRRMRFSRDLTTNDLVQVRATIKAIDGVIREQAVILKKRLDSINGF
jgi:hypothetical protein